MRALILLAIVAACDSSTTGGGHDLSVVTVHYDLAGDDLGGFSGEGGPCGGNIANPKQCLPGLICHTAGVPDVGGTCEVPDLAVCQPNGNACFSGSDCCSGNCILRGSPGFCCMPGGCP